MVFEKPKQSKAKQSKAKQSKAKQTKEEAAIEWAVECHSISSCSLIGNDDRYCLCFPLLFLLSLVALLAENIRVIVCAQQPFSSSDSNPCQIEMKVILLIFALIETLRRSWRDRFCYDFILFCFCFCFVFLFVSAIVLHLIMAIWISKEYLQSADEAASSDMVNINLGY